jgi:hypothetical protein
MISRSLFDRYKKISNELTRRLNHPVTYIISILLLCWTGVGLLLHLGTTWQDIFLNAIKSLSSFLAAVLSGMCLYEWFLKKRIKEREEKQDPEGS